MRFWAAYKGSIFYLFFKNRLNNYFSYFHFVHNKKFLLRTLTLTSAIETILFICITKINRVHDFVNQWKHVDISNILKSKNNFLCKIFWYSQKRKFIFFVQSYGRIVSSPAYNEIFMKFSCVNREISSWVSFIGAHFTGIFLGNFFMFNLNMTF